MKGQTEQLNPFDECARPNAYFGLPEQSDEKSIAGKLRETVGTKIKDLLSMFQPSSDNETREGYLDRI